ncbi:MAG: L,D-transpeptidase [Acidimicrobiia bacterium]|nr:L,D-transpeptidase [Acidimicrobiia bacterium]
MSTPPLATLPPFSSHSLRSLARVRGVIASICAPVLDHRSEASRRRRRRLRPTTIRLAALVAVVATVALGCVSAPTDPQPPVTDRSAVAAEPAPDDGDAPGDDADEIPSASVVVRPTVSVVATTEPGGGEVVADLAPVTEFGSARALLVLDRAGDHLEVLLPVRPNGTTGWIAASDHELRLVDTSIDVDLGARRLTVLDGDDVLLESEIGVGTDTTPTPPGRYAVTDLIATPDAGSPYGPFALGLSGYSEVITDFAGGDGQLGIHGTNDPASIGTAASHGCVRVPNDVVTALVDLVPLGTPVVIR